MEQADLLIEHLTSPQRSLRLAVVTETYPPEINGVALTLSRLIAVLQSRGHQVQLVRPRQPGQAVPAVAHEADAGSGVDLLTRGMPIPRYPHLRMGLPAKKRLVSAWTAQRPDLVHIATEGPLGWSALRAARKLRLPVSTDFRTNFHAYSRHYGIGWLRHPIAAYLRKFHNLADCTMVPTETLRQSLALARFERMHVVARGIDTHAFSPVWRDEALRRHWGAGDQQRVALYVGRLAAEKNLQLLARTAVAMCTEDPTLQWVVVGDGPARAMLQAALPNARFVGSQSGRELARHYASADLFVFPSLTETYGNVVPEAMASGLALVAFDLAAAAELVQHQFSGYLAPADDELAFIQAGVNLARQSGHSREMGRKAREAVLTHDWSRIAAQVEDIWHQILPAPGQDSLDRIHRTAALVRQPTISQIKPAAPR
jgi:glycosyltransferase involved in cell wall biosynthesis